MLILKSLTRPRDCPSESPFPPFSLKTMPGTRTRKSRGRSPRPRLETGRTSRVKAKVFAGAAPARPIRKVRSCPVLQVQVGLVSAGVDSS